LKTNEVIRKFINIGVLG